jgi:hypothetical protein
MFKVRKRPLGGHLVTQDQEQPFSCFYITSADSKVLTFVSALEQCHQESAPWATASLQTPCYWSMTRHLEKMKVRT